MTPDLLRSRILDAIEQAGGMYTIESIEADILAGRKQLWVGDKALVVTEVSTYPKARVMWVLLAAGDLEGVMALQEQGAAWGRSVGCMRMVMDGRKGWAKVLPRYGWEERCVRYSLDLTEPAALAEAS